MNWTAHFAERWPRVGAARRAGPILGHMKDSRTPGSMPTFRVGTWNMDHWKRAADQRRAGWSSLRALRVDAALLQETVLPADVDRSHAVYRPIAGTRPWGNAVVSLSAGPLSEVQSVVTRYSSRAFAMLGTYPGTLVVAQCEVPDFGRVTLVSVYGMIDVYAQTTMLRIVADLSEIERLERGGTT